MSFSHISVTEEEVERRFAEAEVQLKDEWLHNFRKGRKQLCQIMHNCEYLDNGNRRPPSKRLRQYNREIENLETNDNWRSANPETVAYLLYELRRRVKGIPTNNNPGRPRGQTRRFARKLVNLAVPFIRDVLIQQPLEILEFDLLRDRDPISAHKLEKAVSEGDADAVLRFRKTIADILLSPIEQCVHRKRSIRFWVVREFLKKEICQRPELYKAVIDEEVESLSFWKLDNYGDREEARQGERKKILIAEDKSPGSVISDIITKALNDYYRRTQ